MAAAAGRVKLREAIDPLVLAVDVGSTASRGDVYDAAGRPVRGGREKVPHHFTTRDDGTSESTRIRLLGKCSRSLPPWPLTGGPDASAVWLWTRSPPRWSALALIDGLVRRASPMPTPGVQPRSANCDASW